MFTCASILATFSVALSGHGGDQGCATYERGTQRWVPSPEMKPSNRPTT